MVFYKKVPLLQENFKGKFGKWQSCSQLRKKQLVIRYQGQAAGDVGGVSMAALVCTRQRKQNSHGGVIFAKNAEASDSFISLAIQRWFGDVLACAAIPYTQLACGCLQNLQPNEVQVIFCISLSNIMQRAWLPG